MKTYTTVQGDVWDLIAYQQMGSSSYMDDLMMANLEYIDTFRFPAGIVLNIPDVPVRISDDLPPWKR